VIVLTDDALAQHESQNEPQNEQGEQT
jgi:hypothetical protein